MIDANQPRPSEWRMPVGVSGGLWDYLRSPELATGYDAYLGEAGIARLDARLVLDLAKGAQRILDLGCGTGRTLLALAGARVPELVGLDLSPHMLAEAAKKLAPFRERVLLIEENLVTAPSLAPASFDLVCCLFSTLGLVQPAAARQQAVRRAAELLRPGGRFILHGHNRWHNLWIPGGRGWLLRDWLRSFRAGHEAGNWRMPAHQGVAGLVMHLFTRGELCGLMTEAGLKDERILAVDDGADGGLRWPWLLPALRAQGFIAIARRPAP